MAPEAPRVLSPQRWGLLLGGLGAAAAAIAACARRAAEAPGVFWRGAGCFDRGAMLAIVEEVRRRGIAPGEERQFRVRDFDAPAAMVELGPGAVRRRGEGRGSIAARATRDGALQVVIETADYGHAGEFGFAYCDVPLDSVPMGGEGGWHTLDVPGHLAITKPGDRIDPHWWRVLYDLD